MRCTVHVLENCGKINPAKFSIWTCFSGPAPANHFKIAIFSGYAQSIRASPMNDNKKPRQMARF